MSDDERERAIRHLLPVVRTIARRIARLVPGSDLDDLIGDGCVGLIRAVDAFDPTLGPPLEQYARRIVLGAMLNGIRRLDPVSERVRRVVRIAERDRFALAVARGTMPSERELQARHPALGRARADAHNGTPLSLDAPLPPNERHALDERSNPADLAVARSERLRVRSAIAALPSRQRELVDAHYFGERPLRALSVELGVSPQRVSQLHLAAIARIRRSLAPA
jgi:RNA polymerase sigma factor for flagellar operon FliA